VGRRPKRRGKRSKGKKKGFEAGGSEPTTRVFGCSGEIDAEVGKTRGKRKRESLAKGKFSSQPHLWGVKWEEGGRCREGKKDNTSNWAERGNGESIFIYRETLINGYYHPKKFGIY